MGMYPNAYLAYGVNLGQLEDFDPDKNPWLEQFDDGEGYYDLDGQIPDTAPVEAIVYCSYDEAYWVLAIKGTQEQSGDWGASRINLVEPTEEQKLAAASWCKDRGIPWENPGWVLSVFYG